MTEKTAIKRLTASDCTLFEGVFRTIGAGNQKSINLNADVLVGQLFPALARSPAESENEIPLVVTIHGPDQRGPHRVSRKIIKNATYKNWRLDGEFIPGPTNDPTRYDAMQPGDFAIMIFTGDATPNALTLILVRQNGESDAPVHSALSILFGNKSMIAASAEQIALAVTKAGISADHPVHLAAADPEYDMALEDAAQGGLEGAGKLLRNRARRLSGKELATAKARAELTGHAGEGLIDGFLAREANAGHIAGHVWTASDNAVSPYDFEVYLPSGERVLLDVKSTTGAFDNPVHISLAEIIEAAGPTPYKIYRVYELREDGGKLRISNDIGPLATHLKSLHEAHMPPGVRIDSYSVATDAFVWSGEVVIERPDE